MSGDPKADLDFDEKPQSRKLSPSKFMAKGFAVARSINVGGGQDAKYGWLFNDEESFTGPTPRNDDIESARFQ